MKQRNTKLSKVLSSVGKNEFHEYSELIDIIWPTFFEVDGCVLIQKDGEPTRTLNEGHILNQFGDRTGFEAAESHVHMIDVSSFFVENPLEGLRFAMKIMSIWALKLKMDFPYYKFLIILSFHDDDTIIRFHRLRIDEKPWINIDRLDEYKEEGVMIEVV